VRALLLLICCAWGAAANAAQLATTTCDRECLRGKVTQLLYALLKHDVSGLPVADTLRVTEDAVEKPLAKVGLVGTPDVTSAARIVCEDIRQYSRLDVGASRGK
jgi:hypothetical protein